MARYSILIADDDASCRETIGDTISRAGHGVVTAATGTEAIEIVSRGEHVFHATILDMFMPDLTGLQTLEALFRIVNPFPAIFVTADESKELLIKAMEAGAYTLLRKPLSARLVVITVDQLLRKYYGSSGN